MSYKRFNCLKFVKSYPGDEQIHVNELHCTKRGPLASGQREQAFSHGCKLSKRKGESQSQSSMFA